MELCWKQDPHERPTMEQCFRWTASNEFDRLRTEITLGTVTSISAACVNRIEPQHEEEWKPKSFTQDLPTSINGSLVTHEEIQKLGYNSELVHVIAPDEELHIEERAAEEEPPSAKCETIGSEDDDILKDSKKQLTSLQATTEITQQLLGDKTDKEESSKKSFNESYTQVLMCGRDNKKGLLAMYIFPDSQRTHYVSYQVTRFYNLKLSAKCLFKSGKILLSAFESKISSDKIYKLAGFYKSDYMYMPCSWR